jgi:hypothetical protein
MNRKNAVAIPIILLTLLIPFAVPAHATIGGQFPTNIGGQLQALLNSAGFNPCIWPALTEVWYQLLHDWNPSAMMTGSEGTFPEWTGQCGFVPSGGDAILPLSLSASAVGGSGGGTVIPGTWGTPFNLAVNPNAASPIALPEFNPSIAADPTDPNNVVEAQFAMNPAGGLTGSPSLFQCSVAVSHDAGHTYTTAIPSPLPLVVGGGNIVSFCTRAMVAWDSGGTVYILYTEYEPNTVAANARSYFLMVKSTDKGNTWTDLTGHPGVITLIHTVPLVVGGGGSGTEAGIPIFPSLAVSGKNLDVSYTLFSNQPTDDIRSISSTDAGATLFTNPVVIATVNPNTGHFILAPSNAYNARDGALYVVWYDDDTIPPPSSAYHIVASKSVDNGVTWTAPNNDVFNGAEYAGPFHRGILTWPSEWPHLAIEPNSNFAYVVTSWATFLAPPFTNPWNQYRVGVRYNFKGDISSSSFGSVTEFTFPDPAVPPAFDQLFPAVTTQPDGTVHVTWLDTAPAAAAPLLLTGGPASEILYSASNPANLQPVVFPENWAIPQLASGGSFGLAIFSGIFFSVTASSSTASVHGFVHPAWVEAGGTIASLDTFTNRGEKPLLPVGGAVLPTNELALLTPYLLVAVFATLGLAYAMRRRFRGISLPTVPMGNW